MHEKNIMRFHQRSLLALFVFLSAVLAATAAQELDDETTNKKNLRRPDSSRRRKTLAMMMSNDSSAFAVLSSSTTDDEKSRSFLDSQHNSADIGSSRTADDPDPDGTKKEAAPRGLQSLGGCTHTRGDFHCLMALWGW
jgi:hypothetical protein